MTKLQQNKSEFLNLKAEGTESLRQLFALKDEKRAALVELLKDASPEEQKAIRSAYQRGNKKLNEKWKAEHADLIARFKSLREQVKSDDAVLQELLDQTKKIGPADEQFYNDLEALFVGKSEEAKTAQETKNKRDIFEQQWKKGTEYITYMEDERCEELVAKHKGYLNLSGLTSLTDRQAESLAKHGGKLYVPHKFHSKIGKYRRG